MTLYPIAVEAWLAKTFPHAQDRVVVVPKRAPPPPIPDTELGIKNGRPINPNSTMGRIRQILVDADTPVTSAGVTEALLRRHPEEQGKTNTEKVSALLCQEHKRGKIMRGKVGGKAVWSIGETL